MSARDSLLRTASLRSSMMGASVTERMSEGGDPGEEIIMSQLLEYLIVDVEKRRHFQQLPFYLLYLLTFSLLAGLTSHTLRNTIYSDAYLLGRQVEMGNPRAAGVASKEDMWLWLRTTTTRLWNENREGTVYQDEMCSREADGSTNYVLGVVMLRQWRVETETCNLGSRSLKAISPKERQALPCSCSPPYSDQHLSSTPYGPEGQFIADVDRYDFSHPFSVHTVRQSYSNTARQYSVIHHLSSNLSDVLANLSYLETNNWVDTSTRLVSLDLLYFNIDTQLFTRSACYVEYFQTGSVETGCYNVFFDFKNLEDSLHIFIFCLDIIVTLSMLFMIFAIVQEVRKNRLLMPYAFPFTVWLGIEVLHIFIVIFIETFRMKLWALAVEISQDDFYNSTKKHFLDDEELLMFHYLSRYAQLDRHGTNLLAAGVVVSYLRVFKYFQHFSVINMLSETVRYCFKDILRLSIIFSFVLTGYSVCATMLYSSYLSHLETILHSTSWLLRILFMQYEFEWEPLNEVQPLWTPLFMGSYFVICYFLLLNMVLAVVVNAFDHVRNMHELSETRRVRRLGEKLDREIVSLKGRPVPMKLTPSMIAKKTAMTYMSKAKQVVDKLMGTDSGDSGLRVTTIELVKKFCSTKLQVALRRLERKPAYYSRVAISSAELEEIAGKLLSTKDLSEIFEGARKKATEDENMPQLIGEVADKLLAMEADDKTHDLRQDVQKLLELFKKQSHEIQDLKAPTNQERDREREQFLRQQLEDTEMIKNLEAQIKQHEKTIYHCWAEPSPTLLETPSSPSSKDPRNPLVFGSRRESVDSRTATSKGV